MDQSDLEELYQEVILDHYKNPRRRCTCEESDATIEAYNPLCGDAVTVQIRAASPNVCDVCFSGKGCSISQAAASLMAELCSGKSFAEIRLLHALYKRMIIEDAGDESLEELGDAAVLQGIKKFPARYRCALLAWQALEDAILTLE